MLNFNFRYTRLLFLVLIFTATSSVTLSNNIKPVSGQILAGNSNWITSIWRREPKRPRGARGEQACFLSPGLTLFYHFRGRINSR
ncbi:MAG: hypothetical protein AAFS12_05645 [Cyanobacteria bacterium J06632_19]